MRRLFCFAPLLLLAAGAAHADKYSDAIASFKNAGDSAGFFQTCYGYAVFPTVGEAGFILGGDHRGGLCQRGYDRGHVRRQWRRERRDGERRVLERCSGLYDSEGWSHVYRDRGRPEIQILPARQRVSGVLPPDTDESPRRRL